MSIVDEMRDRQIESRLAYLRKKMGKDVPTFCRLPLTDPRFSKDDLVVMLASEIRRMNDNGHPFGIVDETIIVKDA